MRVIYTHTDFDGVVSASLASIATGIDLIRFITPNRIWYQHFTGEEIVCDLPCPWKCRLWFDHHESNLKEMIARGVNVGAIPGKFEETPSCAQLVFDYFKNEVRFPEYFNSLVIETNKIDSMDFQSIDEWMEETPAKILWHTTYFLHNEDYKTFVRYLIFLSKKLRKTSPEELIKLPEVKKRYFDFKKFREYSLDIIKKLAFFHPEDKEKDIVILDTTQSKFGLKLEKNMAYVLFPQASAVLLINSIFKNSQKSTALKFSIGVNFTKKDILNKMDTAYIFEKLKIGGGHRSASGGVLDTGSKNEKEKLKEKYIKEIIKLWYEQKETVASEY